MPKVSLLLSSRFEPTSIRSMHKPNPVHIKTSSETLVPEEPSRKLTRRENLQNFHHRPHSKPAVFAQIRLFSSSHVHIQFHVCTQEHPHNFCQARTQNFVFAKNGFLTLRGRLRSTQMSISWKHLGRSCVKGNLNPWMLWVPRGYKSGHNVCF